MSSTKAIGAIGTSLVPPSWREHEERAHVCQFYAEDDFLLDSIGRFVGTALGAGDSAIVIATKAHREGLAQRLSLRGLDTKAAIKQGRYVCQDAAKTLSQFMRDGSPDARLFADVVGDLIAKAKTVAGSKHPRVTVFGEMVALLWAEGNSRAAIRLEQLWNELAKTHAFSLRCGYPIKDFHSAEHSASFLQICEEHSMVIPGEAYSALLDDEARLRNITVLQQKAQVLEREVAERKRVEQELRLAHNDLEERVAERTAELKQKNQQIVQQAEALASMNQGLRQLSARLLRVQDEERRRIARDLHDSTGQTMALLSMNLSALKTEADRHSPALAKSICENMEIVHQVSGELRTLSYLLHPPLLDEMGLKSALRWYVEGFTQRSGIQVDLELAGELGRLPRDLETAIFRVVQECLTNIHRHSGSPTATIRLSQGFGKIILEIEDAGEGMSPEKVSKATNSSTSGLGLRGMRERIQDFGGEFEVASHGKGTQVKVVIPLAAPAAELQA
jgi:signal transduction histidine kinase